MNRCAGWFFLFALVLVLMEGTEKARREGDLFCVCQWIISPLDFFVLTFYSLFYCQFQSYQ